MASYTEKQRIELINTICERIASGRSLRSVLTDKGMPSRPTFVDWIDDNKERITQYVSAREARADVIFEDMFNIADNTVLGIETTTKANGDVETKEGDMIAHRRLQVDTRKWALSKMNPKKYGDKLEIDSTNKTTIGFQNVSKQFPDEK